MSTFPAEFPPADLVSPLGIVIDGRLVIGAELRRGCKRFHLDRNLIGDDNCRLNRRVTLRHCCAV